MNDLNLDSVQENVETALLVEDQVKDDVNKEMVLEVEINDKKYVKIRKTKNIVD